MKLPPKYEQALQAFVAEYKKNPRVIGILLAGSITLTKPDKNSDLDVQIVLDDANKRTRGNTWINGVEIEYFINPVKQIRQYFREEKSKHTAHMFTHSVILYKKGRTIDELVKEGKKAFEKPFSKISGVQKDLARYALDDLKKDIEDVYVKNDRFAFARTVQEATEKCIITFYAVHRIHPEKNKRLEAYLNRFDKKFAALVMDATLQTNDTKRFAAINKLISYTEKMVGGQRPKKWELTGPLTI